MGLWKALLNLRFLLRIINIIKIVSSRKGEGIHKQTWLPTSWKHNGTQGQWFLSRGGVGRSWQELAGRLSTRKTLVQAPENGPQTQKADVWSSGDYIRNAEHRPQNRLIQS